MAPVSLQSRRAPQELFDGFAEATEAEKADRRQRAIDWLLEQPLDARTIFILPDPETGADLHLRHPGIH